ncbi:hypothetical protein FNV43_RR03813 [Rhamnella rubrinervis]|uniref:Cytochrome b561 and DOMON domain-containing protein n=1 Tax=Rhamnella rubrinervis TaxID=2594499 RepID=A0A8K0HKP7_9ROSA|nr:hypothetical protein FNV43_RR03813 [Rhamnella rubrinervis]
MAKLSLSSFLLLFVFCTSCMGRPLPSSLPSPLPCTNHKFPDGKSFVACKDLTLLNSFLHWNYYPSSGTVDIAFRKIVETNSNNNPRWVAWAINPTSTGMVGSQALVAFKNPDGTLSSYSSPITSYNTVLQKGNLSFPVYDISALSDGNEIVIFATIKLPNNSTVVNHLWQQGPLLPGNVLGMHELSGDNVESFGTLDFFSGKIETSKGGVTKKKATVKNVHGFLNAISWGILMPTGAILARHCLAYVIGVAGWGTGLWLGRKSSGVEYKGHECIGCTLFALATIQVVVGRFCRPNKQHIRRIYWELFHYAVGYGTIILGIINIYKGLNILEPGKSVWRIAYTVIIIALGCIAAVLEAITWILVWMRNKARVEVEAGCVAQDGTSSPTGRVAIP